MISNTIAFILCGGKSSRFESDKAKFKFKGMRLIDIIYKELSGLFENVILVSDSYERFPDYSKNVTVDIVKDAGPLGGLLTAMKYAEDKKVFIIPVDMPNIDTKFLQTFLNKIDETKAVNICKYMDRLYPTLGIYQGEDLKAYLDILLRRIYVGKLSLSMISVLDKFDHNIIDLTSIDGINPNHFLNINYQSDIKEY